MNLYVIFAVTLLISACSSHPQSNSIQGWKISKEIGQFNFKARVVGVKRPLHEMPTLPPEFHIVYLTDMGNGSWSISREGDATYVGTEAIWMDSRAKTIGLAASGTTLQTDLKAASVCEKIVDYDRAQSGYLACNSELAVRVKDLGLILAPLNSLMALTGDRIIAFEADTDKISKALSGIDLNGFAAQLDDVYEEDQRYARQQYAKQMIASEKNIKRFQLSAGVGTRTICGLVINARGNLVELQLHSQMQGTTWVDREEILPPNALPSTSVIKHCARLSL